MQNSLDDISRLLRKKGELKPKKSSKTKATEARTTSTRSRRKGVIEEAALENKKRREDRVSSDCVMNLMRS